MNRAEIIHQNFVERVAAGDFPRDDPGLRPADVGLSDAELVDLFESQVMSRLLDLCSRRLSARKHSFYTIGSAGHEGNAVFGKEHKPVFIGDEVDAAGDSRVRTDRRGIHGAVAMIVEMPFEGAGVDAETVVARKTTLIGRQAW